MAVLRLKTGLSSQWLPDEYLNVIREMVHAPDIRVEVMREIVELDDSALAAEIVPLPRQWQSDDYALFHLDPRVAEAEVDRRTRTEVERWYEEWGGEWYAGRIPDAEYRRIVHEVRIDFRREMDDFKYRLTRGSGRYRDLPDLSTDELSLRLVWL